MFHLSIFLVFAIPVALSFPNNNDASVEIQSAKISSHQFNRLSQSCNENEHWDPCYSHCQHNCSNWGKAIPCKLPCVPGCVCDDGRVRGSDNECILTNRCPELQYIFAKEQFIDLQKSALTLNEIEQISIDRSCPRNEHWDHCYAHCQHNCTNWGKSITCPQKCVAGCVCDDGYVRNSNNLCISTNSCGELHYIFKDEEQLDSLDDDQCPPAEHWVWCNADCEKNCTSKDTFITCSETCVSGCVCNAGFVRGYHGKCTLPRLCPVSMQNIKNSETTDFCPPNEEFSKCFAHCQRNCTTWSDIAMKCPKLCVPGCICKNGMVRGPHGNCIWPRKCPPRDSLNNIMQDEYECPVDEYYSSCTAHCQKNCSNWNQTLSCSSKCISGCVCDEGFIRGLEGKCILPEKCPSAENMHLIEKEKLNNCPANEHKSSYKKIPGLDKYCLDSLYNIVDCPLTLYNGCVCYHGLIRGMNKQCVDPNLLRTNNLDFMLDNLDKSCEDSAELSLRDETNKNPISNELENVKASIEDTDYLGMINVESETDKSSKLIEDFINSTKLE